MRTYEEEDEAAGAEEPGDAAADAAAEAEEAVDERTPLEIAHDDLAAVVAALQREKADFLNYKKRVQREKDDVRLASSRRWAETLLPVLDHLELALQSEGDGDSLKQGVQMILQTFDHALRALGVEPIAAVPGAPFDPDQHEAFGQVASDEHPPGSIAMVLQRGFSYQDRVLRAARVQVVSAGAAPAAAAPETTGDSSGQGE
jgi:molecular chaperone GrpE